MKGFSFERLICHQLSQWWSGSDDRDIFWRTAGSGGRATNRFKKGKKTVHCGDICAVSPDGKPLTDLLTLELKRGYTSASLTNLMDRTDWSAIKDWEEWITKAEVAKENSGSFSWAIICRRDQRKAIITFPKSVFELLYGELRIVTPKVQLEVHIRSSGGKQQILFELVSVLLDDFLALVKKESVIKALERLERRKNLGPS